MSKSGKKQVPADDLKANPFRLNPLAPAASPEDENEATARRLAAMKAEQERKVLEAAGALNLQSIIKGRRKACMINNSMYTEGQQVEDFTIESIESHSIVLVQGEYRIERRMEQPDPNATPPGACQRSGGGQRCR